MWMTPQQLASSRDEDLGQRIGRPRAIVEGDVLAFKERSLADDDLGAAVLAHDPHPRRVRELLSHSYDL